MSGPASVGRWVGRSVGLVVMLLVVASVWRWTLAPEVESIALADARTQQQQQTQTQFEKAARTMCGGNVAWTDASRGMAQCGKTKKVTP